MTDLNKGTILLFVGLGIMVFASSSIVELHNLIKVIFVIVGLGVGLYGLLLYGKEEKNEDN